MQWIEGEDLEVSDIVVWNDLPSVPMRVLEIIDLGIIIKIRCVWFCKNGDYYSEEFTATTLRHLTAQEMESVQSKSKIIID